MKRIVLLLFCVLIISCATRQVKRVDESSVYDLSGRWNDTDSRMVSEEMIEDSLTGYWIRDFSSDT